MPSCEAIAGLRSGSSEPLVATPGYGKPHIGLGRCLRRGWPSTSPAEIGGQNPSLGFLVDSKGRQLVQTHCTFPPFTQSDRYLLVAPMLCHVCECAWPLDSQRPLLAYMSSIIRVSQDYTRLAWGYDAAFRRQAALTGNRRWSQINATIYTVCFTGNAQVKPRCELCLGTTHCSRERALWGDADPEMQTRAKAIEAAVLALSAGQVKASSTGQGLPSGQVCQLWNRNVCTYARCQYTHVCSSCGAGHPAIACTKTAQAGASSSGQGASSMANRRAREFARPN